MRILYLGLPLGACILAGSGFVPVALGIGHPHALGAARIRRLVPRSALILGRPNLEDPEIERLLASAEYDVLLSWFWPKKIPRSILERAARGAFGVHPSLLPRWRGPDPYFHAIAAGDPETGVTLHRLDAEYDTGAVVKQIRVPIHPDQNAWQLAKQLDRPSLALLLECARRLASGDPLDGRPQPESGVSHAPAPSDEALVLRFTERDAVELERLVRAAAPNPGTSALLESHLVTVSRAEEWNGVFPGGLRPGEAFRAVEGVVVRATSGGLLLRRVETEAGETLEGSAIARLLTRE